MLLNDIVTSNVRSLAAKDFITLQMAYFVYLMPGVHLVTYAYLLQLYIK